MSAPLNIMLVAHGFPPNETAGTERHTAALAEALERRGHRVTVVAATRRPGEDQYGEIEEGNVIRIVNNIATRPLSEGESDPIIDRIMADIETRIRPDIVHVHHIQFLSSTMHFQAPTVVTLHDEWAWCASGGLGLQSDGGQCPGPAPQRCAPCHAAWRPQPSAAARRLTRAARALSPLVRPDRLIASTSASHRRSAPLQWHEVHRQSHRALQRPETGLFSLGSIRQPLASLPVNTCVNGHTLTAYATST